MNTQNPSASRQSNPASLARVQRAGRVIASIADAANQRKGDAQGVASVYAKRYPQHAADVQAVVQTIRANEVQGGTTSGTWGDELAGSGVNAELLAAINYVSADGALRARGAVDVPANVVSSVLAGAFGAAVLPEGQAIPLSSGTASQVTVSPVRVAGLVVVTKDLLRRANAEQKIGVAARDGVATATDVAMLSTNGYGLRNGALAIVSGGGTARDIDFDLNELLTTLVLDFLSTVLITTPAIAVGLSLLRDVNGGQAYPGVTVNGGTLAGLPLIVTRGAPSGTLTAIDASAICRTDDGVTLELSTDATIEMASDPTGNVATPTGQTKQRVSLFENEAVAIKCVRRIGWKSRRASAVGSITSLVPSNGITTA